MIELMFGDAKNPRPAPRSIMYTTSNGYGVDASVVENRNRDKLVRASPVVVNGRCPYLSESRPLSGPAARVAMSVGMIRRPASSGFLSRTSWKYRLSRRRTAPEEIAVRVWEGSGAVCSRIGRRVSEGGG